MNVNQRQTLTHYHLQGLASALRKFTQTKTMISIVNGFIQVMPVIIAASVFTLIIALPETVLALIDNSKDAWWKTNATFLDFQNWGGPISNWSMGIIGLFVTASIARNLAQQLNTKLPFERRMNEIIVFFAAMSCYLMLSVITFSIPGSKETLLQTNSLLGFSKSGRAIFVDGLAAQGILPGILIGITLPYFFYFGYKYNWTIRLPRQVPQTISQAFLAVIPLFITLFVYGLIGWGFTKLLNQPVLFYLFTKIQEGLTGNPNINNSYGLLTLYAFMEGGFWFLGVHPEPVHAVMRAAFWTQNVSQGGHIFIEPIAYGFAAMGGSGATLMVPVLCLMFCRSQKLLITGKTGFAPIIFQVNEPVLFGVPTILNPLFFAPMIFAGMTNVLLFKALADSTSFNGGTLNLPWSVPYFLQTTLGTPTQWQPWLFSVIALINVTIWYLPFLIIQDRIYVQEERLKLGLNGVNFAPLSLFDILRSKWFNYDAVGRTELKKWLKEQKENLQVQLSTTVDGVLKTQLQNQFNKKLEHKKDENKIIALNNLVNFQTRVYQDNLLKYESKAFALKQKYKLNLESAWNDIHNKQDLYKNKIENYQKSLETMQNFVKNPLYNKSWKLSYINFLVGYFEKKLNYAEKKLKIAETKKAKVTLKKDPDALFANKKIFLDYQKNCEAYRIWQKQKNLVNNLHSPELKKLASDMEIKWDPQLTYDVLKNQYQDNIAKQKNANDVLRQQHSLQLMNGINPWEDGQKIEPKISTTNKSKRKYTVLVLCVGAGSSAVLANTINDGLISKNQNNIEVTALAWGQHESALEEIDLLILSPQLGMHLKNVQSLSQAYGFKYYACKGHEYIDLSKNANNAADLVLKNLPK